MSDSRTNSLLAQIIVAQEKLSEDERSNITIFFNGGSITGKALSDEEYYNRPENSKFKEIYYSFIKIPREPFIKCFEETRSIVGFPDNLRQVYLHILDSSGRSIQVRMADVVAFSFD